MTSDILLTQILSGLTSASLLFLVATGLTLLFGALQIINIAHGSFYMLGAFILASMLGSSWAASLPMFWIALVVVPLVVAAVGVVMEVLVLRPLYGKEHLLQLLATFGLLYLCNGVALKIWGGEFRSVSIPAVLGGRFQFFGGTFPVYNLFIMGVAVTVGLFLWWLLQRTQLGWRIRAAVEDREMLAVAGVNVRMLFTGVFALGAVLAAIAGVVVGPIGSITTGLSTQILVEAFIVVVIGGLGSIPGAAVGAIIIGMAETAGVLWMPEFASAFIYVAMILVLALRPSGLMGAGIR
ncbi:MAG: branched-chain amino acid ABC transporter permease [Ottowia sp.]|nr:branched-chain amino acid ABC transporter permease [Ottowia sp.]